MSFWAITPEWKGQPSYIIGGGSSLRGFDFDLLKGKNTIGVNDAFRLGPEIVKICLFGDSKFFQKAKWDLEKFKGRVVTTSPAYYSAAVPWLLRVKRTKDGLVKDGTLGWNYSTGATAINLALALGSPRVYLLGIDLALNARGQSHWHGHHAKTTDPALFERFKRGFERIYNDLNKTFPGAEVINVTNGLSQLPNFKRISFEQFFQEGLRRAA